MTQKTPYQIFQEIQKLSRNKSDREIARILNLPVDMIQKIIKHYSTQETKRD